jgi:hypothetical protein
LSIWELTIAEYSQIANWPGLLEAAGVADSGSAVPLELAASNSQSPNNPSIVNQQSAINLQLPINEFRNECYS